VGEAELIDFIQGADCGAFASLTAKQKSLLLLYAGDAYTRKGDYDHAIADYTKMIGYVPEDAGAYKLRGDAYASNRHYDNAIADYTEMIELAPSSAASLAYEIRGRAYTQNGSYNAALADYNKAIKLDPKNASYFDDRGRAFANEGDYDRAIADFTKAIELDPKNVAYNDRGLAYQNKLDYDRAAADYNEAIRIDPQLPQQYAFAHDSLGRVALEQGKIDGAVTEFRKAVELAPTDTYSAIWLYLARARTGAHNAAAELKSNEKKLKHPDWPYPVVELFLGRRTPEATLAAPTTPDNHCEAEFFVGEWQLVRGDHPKAIDSLEAAVDTCPKTFVEFDFARAELKRLEP
jgi:tetratricopeptide (TPR) repeat protein